MTSFEIAIGDFIYFQGFQNEMAGNHDCWNKITEVKTGVQFAYLVKQSRSAVAS